MTTYRVAELCTKQVVPAGSALLNHLLSLRQITTEAEAELFLSPNYDEHLHDPELLHQVSEAAGRIEAAMREGERIAIFSDYDCDGIPGAVVLHDFFKAVKYTNFQNYIPHRHYEGFGLSTVAVDVLQKADVTLIITIDCGTTDIEAVAHAKALGIDVIITDHHEPPAVLPEAVAIVNPKLGEYPFIELCGAAVVFKLVQVLLKRSSNAVPPGFEKWWLDMVGIATIADMVPLKGENRVLAHFGLQVLRKSRRPGLQHLLHKNRIDQRLLTEEDIGFTIGPRINAASRMDTPEDAFVLLASTDVVEAGARADHLERLNRERKAMVAVMTKDLHKRLEHLDEIPNVLVLGNPEWRPSLVGLAANKLAEEHKRPVFLWGRDGNGVYKGSCRSGGGVSVVTLMETVSDVFHEHGGHHFSGGFSIKDEQIFNVSQRLNEALTTLGEAATINDEVVIDARLTLDDITSTLLSDLAKLSPFGASNHKPLFAFVGVKPVRIEQFGKAKEHTKLLFRREHDGIEAIAFFSTPDSFLVRPEEGVPCTVLAHVEQSFFMGRRQIRLRIVDIVSIE